MAALASSRSYMSRFTRRYSRASTGLQIAVVIFALGAAVVFGAGRLDIRTSTYLLILPLVLLAVLRPAWLVMLLVAIPPAVMNLASIRAPTVILLFALVVHLARKGGLSTGLVVGALPIVALLALGYLFRADVTSTAAVARENFLKQLTYYVM